MEKDFTEYETYRDSVRNDLERYTTIIEYALVNPERVSANIDKYLEVINSTERMIRSNTASILNGFEVPIEEKVKQLEAVLGRILIGEGKELENF